MKYFENCKSIEELKKEYRRLVVQNHPDNGGSLEVMKAINAEYEKAFDRLKERQPKKSQHKRTTGAGIPPHYERRIKNVLFTYIPRNHFPNCEFFRKTSEHGL